MFEGNKCTLSKKELAALLAFMSTEEDRPNLNCAVFQPEKGHVVATDGHSLLRMEGEPGEGTMTCIARDTLVRLSRTLHARDALVVTMPKGEKPPKRVDVAVVERSKHFELKKTVLSAKVDRVEATPPDFDVVIPKRKTPLVSELKGGEPSEDDMAIGRLGLRGAFMSRLRVLENAAGREGVECYFGKSELDPALFVVRNLLEGRLLRAVIMPMRI